MEKILEWKKKNIKINVSLYSILQWRWWWWRSGSSCTLVWYKRLCSIRRTLTLKENMSRKFYFFFYHVIFFRNGYFYYVGSSFVYYHLHSDVNKIRLQRRMSVRSGGLAVEWSWNVLLKENQGKIWMKCPKETKGWKEKLSI